MSIGTEAVLQLPKNQKLTDEQIVEMRTVRATPIGGVKLDWNQLGEMFGINWKTAYRICLGFSRESAGGPIEAQQIPSVEDLLVRCKTCGCRHSEAEVCRTCSLSWTVGLLRVLRLSGIVRIDDVESGQTLATGGLVSSES